jgi:hypothetical protein
MLQRYIDLCARRIVVSGPPGSMRARDERSLTELDRRVYKENATAAYPSPLQHVNPAEALDSRFHPTHRSPRESEEVNMKIQAIVVRGLALGALIGVLVAASGSHADSSQGLCNALIAQALGTGIQVALKGPSEEQCAEIGAALGASLEPPCLNLVLDTELGILKASNGPTGELSNLGTLICTSLDECGFTPLPFGLCPGFPG